MTVIAFSPSQPDGASPSDLRRKLADAIADRQAAENAARSAKAIFERAKAALIEATGEVQRLTADLSAKRDAVIREDAVRLTRAHREGREPPPALPALDHGSPALDAAQARYRASEMAAAQLQDEHLKANEAALRAAAKVRALIEDIQDAEVHALAEELIARTLECERLSDRIAGYLRIDGARPVPRLGALQRRVRDQVDRRRREQAREPRLIERIEWNAYFDRIEAGQASKWRDYAARLADDPLATPVTVTAEGEAA